MKNKKTMWVFLLQKYGKFRTILQSYFNKHKPLNSEECTSQPYKVFIVMYFHESKICMLCYTIGYITEYFHTFGNKKEEICNKILCMPKLFEKAREIQCPISLNNVYFSFTEMGKV